MKKIKAYLKTVFDCAPRWGKWVLLYILIVFILHITIGPKQSHDEDDSAKRTLIWDK